MNSPFLYPMARLIAVILLTLIIYPTGFTYHALAEKAKNTNIVAHVNGASISVEDYNQLRESLGEQLLRIPADQQRTILVDELVTRLLVTKEAEKLKLQDSDDFKQQITMLRQQILRNIYFEKIVEAKITDADIQTAYDKLVSEFKNEQEVRASHILVKTKEEAEELIKSLKEGKDFAELAKEKSTGPSAKNGGDLGFFTKGRMVPEFEEVAFKLKPGEYSTDPIKTQFGWHIIRVEEARMTQPPALDAIREQIRQTVLRDKVQEAIAKLRKEAKIEIIPAKNDKKDEQAKDQ